ncbi:MAG: HlyD family efflux transporter periplasmic adaptor subunit [Gammaproteobacteria bacterium]
MPLPRIAGLFLVAFLVAAGLVWGFWPRPVKVETAEVARQAMDVAVEEEGRTRVKERYELYAPVAGYLRRIELEAGDAVESGQVLVELEPLRSAVLDPRSRAEAEARVRAAGSALERARNEMERARAQAELADEQFERRRDLLTRELISRSEYDQAESDQRAADAALEAARSAVQVARYDLAAAEAVLEYSAAGESGGPAETVELRSPVTGVVLKRFRESEGVVDSGTPLLEVGDPAQLEVEVEVLSRDAVRIAPGGTVYFERWGGGQAIEGQVRNIEPQGFTKISALGVEEQRVLVIADFVAPREAWERLGDGYRVEARFIVWSREDALTVPASALFRRDGAWSTFRVDGGEAELVPVEVGENNGLVAEVLGGLAEGDAVIVHPDDEVSDGAHVESYH